MKILIKITIICLLITQNLTAQYNLSPDAPLNPVPIKFHKDHFLLKGDIKKQAIKFVEYGIYYELNFNRQGYIINYNGSGFNSDYFYDKNNRLINIVKTESGLENEEPLKITGTFISDEKNRPVKRTFSDGIVEEYQYDTNGNLIKLYSNRLTETISLTDNYLYDNQNRLIEWQQFNDNGKMYKTTYSYQKEGDILKINKKSGDHITVLYFKNGHPYQENIENVKWDKNQNPLSNGNDETYQYIYFTDNNTTSSKNKCLSGNCQNGWGIKIYEDGKYTGFFENGIKQGYGNYMYKNGEVYEGQWEKDKKTGLGVYVLGKKDIKQGEFVDGKLNGLGMYNKVNGWERGIYSDDSLETAYSIDKNGQTTGCVAGDCENKYGKYVYANGEYFAGFWKNGKMYLGHYFFPNNDFYFGYFNAEHQFDKYGFLQQSGQFYFGQWKNGKHHGKGFLKKTNGSSQAGIWENGQLINSLM